MFSWGLIVFPQVHNKRPGSGEAIKKLIENHYAVVWRKPM